MTTLPRRPLVVDDLAAMPEDGHRYELLDGALIVTPSPTPRHQVVVSRLLRVLATACPDGLEVLVAPLDVVLADDTLVQPDLVVTRRSDLHGPRLAEPPLLAVEVLSPSTRGIDLGPKWARYQRGGVPAYWVIDPDRLWMRAWELVEGRYAEVAHVAAAETWRAASPYDVTLAPGRLAD